METKIIKTDTVKTDMGKADRIKTDIPETSMAGMLKPGMLKTGGKKTDFIKNTAFLCYQLCLYLALCSCVILLWRSLVQLRDTVGVWQDRMTHLCFLLMVPASVICLAVIFQTGYHGCRQWLRSRRLAVCLMAALILAQICFAVFVSRPMYTTDTLRIHNEAIAMLTDQNGWIDMSATYFQRYTNNHFIVVLFYYYYMLVSGLGITDYWTAAIVLNTVCIDLGILLAYLSVRKLRGDRTANLFLILSIICPTSYVWLTFAYTNTVSIPFTTEILYLFLIFDRRRSVKWQIVWGIVYGLCIVTGYKIRPTTILPLIAVVLYMLYQGMTSRTPLCHAVSAASVTTGTDRDGGSAGSQPEKNAGNRPLHSAVLAGIIVVTCLAAAAGTGRLLQRHVPAGYEEEEFPLTHWIMMGLNTESNGGFYDQDVIYSRSFPTKAEKTRHHMMEIRRRLAGLGPAGYGRLVIGKLDRVWADGSDTSFEKASFGAGYGPAYERVMGRDNLWFRLYCQAFRAATFLYICISIVYQIMERRRGDPSGTVSGQCQRDDLFVYVLTLLGCIAFFVLWEANPKYNICFMNICMMIMADGIRAADKGCRSCGLRPSVRRAASAAVFSGAMAVAVTGLRSGVVAGNNIRYVYRAEMQDKGSVGKQALQKAVTLRQTVQKGADREKVRWNTLELVFQVKEGSRAEDSYHLVLRSMPGKTVLSETDITSQDLDGRGRYRICGNMEPAPGDSYYELEIRHKGRKYSMYPRLQRSAYLDMYPYGELSIDGSVTDYDLCMELYENRLADESGKQQDK